jgi:heat-inducible transcriptional repressor
MRICTEMKKLLTSRRAKKTTREQRVLLGLVELYIDTGKPVGSATLHSRGFSELSAATIRNYFARLEREGYLQQQHASGGRIPTARAFQAYASAHEADEGAGRYRVDEERLKALQCETKEAAAYVQAAGEQLAQMSGLAVFLTAPRFDHDFVLEIKLVSLDATRCLCVMLTDFGSILTEVLQTERKLGAHSLRRMEHYFAWRLTGHDLPEPLPEGELRIAARFYHELMVRYITRYSSFTEPDLFRMGFSNLLAYPEFKSAAALANGLALFESSTSMRRLLHECEKGGVLRYWIGEMLAPFAPSAIECAVVAVPYRINQLPVGAIGLLGPMRLDYRRLFAIARRLSEVISESLTKSLYRYRIQFRQPTAGTLYLPHGERRMLLQTSQALFREKREDEG